MSYIPLLQHNVLSCFLSQLSHLYSMVNIINHLELVVLLHEVTAESTNDNEQTKT